MKLNFSFITSGSYSSFILLLAAPIHSFLPLVVTLWCSYPQLTAPHLVVSLR